MEKQKNCKYCKSEISADAKVCPNCRKKQGVNIWLIIIIISVFVVGIFASTSGNNSTQLTTQQADSVVNSNDVSLSQDNSESKISNTTEKFSISETSVQEDSFAYYITGTITNNTNKDKTYVQVVFNLYDKDGNQIGTAMDTINGLKAGGSWKFKALALEDKENIDRYELFEITGF